MTTSEIDPNNRQVAGSHYKSSIQHWDFVIANDLNYFEGQVTKYVARARKKNGIQDLLKAQHFLEKYIAEYSSIVGEEAGVGYVNQDRQTRTK